MIINIKDTLTLDDNNEYVVISKTNYENKNYYYLLDKNNNENLKFCYEDNDELVEINDKEFVHSIGRIINDQLEYMFLIVMIYQMTMVFI